MLWRQGTTLKLSPTGLAEEPLVLAELTGPEKPLLSASDPESKQMSLNQKCTGDWRGKMFSDPSDAECVQVLIYDQPVCSLNKSPPSIRSHAKYAGLPPA